MNCGQQKLKEDWTLRAVSVRSVHNSTTPATILTSFQHVFELRARLVEVSGEECSKLLTHTQNMGLDHPSFGYPSAAEAAVLAKMCTV